VEVVAVASRETSRAEAYARDNGIARAHGSYEALLEDDEVEAVYISLPNSLHVEWSIRALAAGKHVLCEKPLAALPQDADRAFDAAASAGLVLAEAFMYRHHPQTLRLKEEVERGSIGALRLIRGAFSFPLDDPDDPRLVSGMDGGSLMDVGCYCVNLARYLAGEPERVFAEQQVNEHGMDLRFAGTLAFAHGVVAQFDSGLDLPDRMSLEVVGANGSMEVRDPWHCLEPRIEIHRDGRIEAIETPPLDAYRLELEDFAAAVRGERPPRLGREDAVGQAAAIEALHVAAGRRQPVDLPL
jgi:predicted dehydrogenase